MAGDELGLRELNEIARKEKNARMLLPLTNDFYVQCQDYVQSLEGALKEEDKGTGQNPKAMMLGEELQKANSKISSIFSLRQRKILLLVYNRSSGAGRESDMDSLTEEEKMFFEEVLCVLEDSRNTILGSSPMKKKKLKTLFTRRTKKEEVKQSSKVEPAPLKEPFAVTKTASPLPLASDVPEEEPSEETEDITAPPPGFDPHMEARTQGKETAITPPVKTPIPRPALKGDDNMATVVVMTELPPLMGPESVYELSPQDVVSLPKNMALLLEKEGKVKRLDPA